MPTPDSEPTLHPDLAPANRVSLPNQERERNLDFALAVGLLRLTTGINMLLHGATRIFGDMGGFIEGTVKGFEKTILPSWSVQLFATGLPFIEALIGLLLILGLFTRPALVLGALTIGSLVFGMSLRSEWTTVGLQMTYAVVFSILLFGRHLDQFSLDRLLAQRLMAQRKAR
jgi:thiosulfate dehydrogenase [quinone] large subunit